MKLKEFVNKIKLARVGGTEMKNFIFNIKILKGGRIEVKKIDSIETIEEEIEILETEIVAFLDFTIDKYYFNGGIAKHSLYIDVLVK